MSGDDARLGRPVPGWFPPPRPGRMTLEGRWCRIEPLSPAHAPALHAANIEDAAGTMWDYLSTGPYTTLEPYAEWVAKAAESTDPLFFAVFDKDRARWGGTFSFLRIDPPAGSIEVGWIAWSPLLQQSRAATEAVWLLMDWAFRSGYRRFEWKCNALNTPSRRAALRFGLSYEGLFRQANVVKGRNRDTAWYAAIDAEHGALSRAFATWLDPANFDATGRQKQRLSDLTRPILVSEG